MRRKMVAGNWKMHGSADSVRSLATAIVTAVARFSVEAPDVVVFPSFTHLLPVGGELQGSPVLLGAQNLYPGVAGAFTGEVAGPMLREAGCVYVLVGHSERRQLFHEDLPLVTAKFIAAGQAGLLPVLCVGETAAERSAGQTETVIAAQLDAVLQVVGPEGFGNAVIAYEPVWAIGTGKAAQPEDAGAVHRFIRQWLGRLDIALASRVQILYGGSVRPDNAPSFFAMPDIDGALVGGAALKAEDFLAICDSAR